MNNTTLTLSLLAITIATLTQSADSGESSQSEETTPHRFLLIDTHIDTPSRAIDDPMSVFDRESPYDFNIPKAIEGQMSGAFMSIYTSPTVADEDGAMAHAHRLLDWVETVDQASDEVLVATCTADVRHAFEQNTLALALGMENGSPLEGEVANLDQFVKRGIRYITLTHAKSNEFSDSSYDENEPHQGLSEAGKALVTAMNQHGVMIDISHLTDKAAWQVLELTQVPVVATHSSLRHFIPGFHRNMSDEMVIALGKNGGVIHINFGSGFVKNESREWTNRRTEALSEQLSDESLTREDRLTLYAAYAVDNPYPFADVGDVADHIDRVVELAGVDHVGFGSDFDGVGDTLPTGIKDASEFPNLVTELIERGYSQADLAKILGENLMRVWRANEEFSEIQGFDTQCNLVDT